MVKAQRLSIQKRVSMVTCGGRAEITINYVLFYGVNGGKSVRLPQFGNFYRAK